MSDLARLGFEPADHAALDAAGLSDAPVGRIARIDRGWATAWLGDGASARLATTGGAGAEGALAVGDWVAVDASGERAAAVLPRRSALARRSPSGSASAQVLAANVDVVGLCHALSSPPKPRRLERELVVAFDSGARPVVILTKADLAGDVEAACQRVAGVAPAVEVVPVAARRGDGLEAVRDLAAGGRTLALLGASGVGKSTLVNALVGVDVQRTEEVRAGDQRGRHTTTAAELVVLPGGGVLVDTPGLRAVALWSEREGEGLARAFADVVTVAQRCRFADCTHRDEPDCAVRDAVDEGALDPARVLSWQRLSAELADLTRERREAERGESGRGRGRRR